MLRDGVEHGCVVAWAQVSVLMASQRPRYLALLGADEKQRYARFRHVADADRFACARGVLRDAVAAVTGSCAGAVEIAIGESGKPALRRTGRLHVNLSHSDDVVAVALAVDGDVGVDVERVRPVDFDTVEFARTSFHPCEADRLGASPSPVRLALFYAHWTVKEAALKQRGVGLSGSLREPELFWSGSPSRPRARTGPGAQMPEGGLHCWRHHALDYMLALSAQRPAVTLVEATALGFVHDTGWRVFRPG